MILREKSGGDSEKAEIKTRTLCKRRKECGTRGKFGKGETRSLKRDPSTAPRARRTAAGRGRRSARGSAQDDSRKRERALHHSVRDGGGED